MRIGVLALQGDFAAHRRALARAGAAPLLVRAPHQLDDLDGLVLPGGESTAMLHGIARDGLSGPLATYVASGRAVLGTCAGAILLARRVTNPVQRSFAVLDVDVERNAYGTQLDSFVASLEPGGAGRSFAGARALFIRAPRLVRVGKGVEVLARVGRDPVLVRCGAAWAATFHPELADDDRVLRAWLAESVLRPAVSRSGTGAQGALPPRPAHSDSSTA